MRNIKYLKKRVSANTEYRKISREDLNWILGKLQELQIFIDECESTYDLEVQEVYKILCTPLDELPRQGYEPYQRNSIRSFAKGVIKNFFTGGQRDLSNKTCEGLIVIFTLAEALLADYEQVNFVESIKLDVQPKTIAKDTNNTNKLFEFV
jgi:hypothetical protein